MKNTAQKYDQASLVLGNVAQIEVPELRLRFVRSTKKKFLGRIRSSEDAARFLRKTFRRGEIEVQEQVVVLFLNRESSIIGYYKHTIGGIAGSIVDVRLILSVALKCLASGIILCHNHPSGNKNASSEDIQISKKLKESARLMDIKLLDHIILTKDSYLSLSDESLFGLSDSKRELMDHAQQEFVEKIQHLLQAGTKQDKRMVEKLAASLSIYDRTEIKELTELAIVYQARKIAQDFSLDTFSRYQAIVSLYHSQVNLSHRTSQSILLQQYSTPAPIGFLAGIFCGGDTFANTDKLAFEPSAGNGLLTIAFPAEQVVVNEIDPIRNRNLHTQNYQQIYQVDATEKFTVSIASDFSKKFDAIVTNPPFGRLYKTIEYDGYPIHTLDHLMALRALDTLKDSGRAAFIIGGHTEYDEKGRIQKGQNRIFFNYLYKYYHVLDVIPINGSKLYSRQGTSFDVRLILINGRKQSPSGAAPVFNEHREKEVKSFDELYARVQESVSMPDVENVSNKSENMNPNINPLVELAYQGYWNYKAKHGDGIPLIEEENSFFTFDKDALSMNSITGLPLHAQSANKPDRMYVEFQKADLDYYLHKIVHAGKRVDIIQRLIDPKKNKLHELDRLEKELENEIRRLRGEQELGAPYEPASQSCVVLNTVVPDSMEYETKQALEFIQREVGGNMDEFVRQRLGYNSKIELCKALSAEQTDAVAMAIYNIEAREQGMIIGDQTGIGKGRVAAALIRYAVLQGHKPIFITEKPNLFSDIYRDLSAIGSGHLTPFIVNGKESKTDIKDEGGEILFQALAPAEQQVYFKDKRIPAFADLVLATYSQFNSPDKKPEKPQFLLEIAEGTILILDESHNASGSSQVGTFLQAVLAKSKGVVFLSATFAKRPDNMPIYAMKTAISDANMTKEDLIAAIIKGGVALQEVLASQLVKEGQMLRRERSFEGIEVNYITLDELETEHRAIADNITDILREIISFQNTHIDTAVEELDEIAVAEGKEVKLREGTSQAGVDNLPYFSKVFQVINQMLFSIKASAVADKAIQHLKAGLKPVIAFSSTMGSFIEQMENEAGLPVAEGDTIHADFSAVLMRGLDGVLRYTVTTPEGKKEFKKFDLAEFSKEARERYFAIAAKINQLSTGISISPIDIILQKIKTAGYRVAEVTGRKYEVQINTQTNQGIVMGRKKVNVNDAFREFNNNEIDVLMINQSGSTGASAHAIVTNKVPAAEVKKRVMIVLQAELNINTEVQKRGRVNRTGQILLPQYDYIMSAIPAEKRLMMMLQKKLKSLDANTTSNQKQSTKILDVPDFLNKYGDKVVTQYLQDNAEINMLLGDPLGLTDTSNEKGEILEEASHRVSGRVAVLSTKMQADFYTEIAQSYNEYIEYLKQIGEYDLEVEAMNLEAETISEKVVRMGKGGDSEFGTDSILEKIEANVLKKPFSKSELENILKESLQESTADMIQKEISKDYELFTQQQLERELAETKHYYHELFQDIPKEKKAIKIRDKDGQAAYLQFIQEREKELKGTADKQIEKIKTAMFNRKQYMNSLFKFFYVGKNILYPVNSYSEGDIKMKAVFLGFIIDKKKKNPYAPSNIRLRFALASPGKYIAMPASYAKDINSIIGASYAEPTGSLEDTLQKWDQAIKQSSVNRNTRYVISGNLLQAFADYQGKLVSYTTLNGETKKGILMPEYWEPEEDLADRVSVPVARAEKVIKSLIKGNGLTTENETSIFNTGDGFKIIVPASRQKGGDVFLDANILKLVTKHNFEKTADKMIAFMDAQYLTEFLAILQSKFNDSVKLDLRQFNLIKGTQTQSKARNPIILLSEEEAKAQQALQFEIEIAEAELELDLELLRLRNKAA